MLESIKQFNKGIKKYIPQSLILNVVSATNLYNNINRDILKGYFNDYPNTALNLYTIKGKLWDISKGITNVTPFTEIEIITLKANDYIKDNKFKIPLWYYNPNSY